MNNLLHFRSYFKFLGRNRLYTVINVLGLSVSLMFVILLAVYTTQELSVDKFHKNAGRIYALGNERDTASGYGITPYLLSRYPEIEKITAFTNTNWTAYIGDSPYKVTVGLVDSTFLDIFSFKMIEGDPSVLYTATGGLVSESYARKAFPGENPIGKIFTFGEGNSDEDLIIPIVGIIEDFKHSIIPEVDIVLPAQLASHFNGSISNKHMNNAGGVIMFLMLHEGADLVSKTDDMVEYFKEFYWIYQNDRSKEVILTPLRDIYFHNRGGGSFWINTGDITLVKILVSVGLLILIFALINYINLTVAQTGFRAKEMATRRLLGASRNEIFVKFILESTIMCALAFVVGLLLAGAFEGIFTKVLNAEIDVFGSIGWDSAVLYLLVIILLGVVSGIIPAVFISRYRSIDVVKGSFTHKSKMLFSKVFIVFQNVITMTLIASALTMSLQIRHMINAPLGFNTENILDIDIGGFRSKEQITTFKNEVANLASVRKVSLAQGHPLNGGNNNSFVHDGRPVSTQHFEVDSVFMEMFGFEVIEASDTYVGKTYSTWINETAAAELGLSEDGMNFRYGGRERLLGGIVKDFRLRMNFDHIPPVTILIRRDMFWPWQILVEVQGDQAQAYHEIGTIFKNITELDMEASYLEEQIRESYGTQRRVFNIVLIFTVVAVLISMLGLLAMSTYFMQQKAGEIAIRKVFGSTRGEMFRRLVLGFMKLVLLAFVISVPVIWYAMTQWLSTYPYRIGLSPLIFAAAGLTAIVIAALSVAWQSARAANANPIDSIKS